MPLYTSVSISDNFLRKTGPQNEIDGYKHCKKYQYYITFIEYIIWDRYYSKDFIQTNMFNLTMYI